MSILKKIVISFIILPFFLLTSSFCCFKMMTASANGMTDCCSSMAPSDTIGQNLKLHGSPSHSSDCQCEQLTESYDKVGLKNTDLHKSILNNPKAFIFASQAFTRSSLIVSPFLNYHSPPKSMQNSLPLYLQISVLRI